MKADVALNTVLELRRFADFIEAKYEDIPDTLTFQPYSYVWPWSERVDDVASTMAAAGKAALGHADLVAKVYPDYSDTFKWVINFGTLAYTITCDRGEVCTKKITGTKEVTKEVPVTYETQTVTEDIVEWECHPILDKVITDAEPVV